MKAPRLAEDQVWEYAPEAADYRSQPVGKADEHAGVDAPEATMPPPSVETIWITRWREIKAKRGYCVPLEVVS